MTLVTVDPRCGSRPPNPDMVADVVARRLDTGDEIVGCEPAQRSGWLSVFLADARLLANLAPGRQLLDEIADQLWMVCAGPGDIERFAVSVAASHAEGLLSGIDVLRIIRDMIRSAR